MRRRSSASKSLRTPAGNPMPHTIARNAGMRQYIIRNSIVYGTSALRQVQLTWRSRAGTPQASIGAPGIYSEARLSPDERRLVLTRINPETGTSDLWILELSTGILSRLTSHASEDA